MCKYLCICSICNILDHSHSMLEHVTIVTYSLPQLFNVTIFYNISTNNEWENMRSLSLGQKPT